jgi:hypothetical protein
MSPNITCSISLESYNPYPHLQKVSKNPKIHCIHSSLPKNAESHFGSLGPLGIKFVFDGLPIDTEVKCNGFHGF